VRLPPRPLYGEWVRENPYDDGYLASLYDQLNPWGPSDQFYLHLVASATDVLDIGCGTGAVLRRARRDGHPGRLVGIDPAAAMLDVARRDPAVEWVTGYLPDAGYRAEFDLALMTGHAFQELSSDDEVRRLLLAVAQALRPGRRFAFETRNPRARPWEKWAAAAPVAVTDQRGRSVRVATEVDGVDGEYVRLTETSTPEAGDPVVGRSTLRFINAEHLDHLLAQAGFTVDERYGDWDRSLFTPTSPEIITIASVR
jgi:SAM-dependent methyltransferase